MFMTYNEHYKNYNAYSNEVKIHRIIKNNCHIVLLLTYKFLILKNKGKLIIIFCSIIIIIPVLYSTHTNKILTNLNY